jgi:tellurite resistance protein TehA-like permease
MSEAMRPRRHRPVREGDRARITAKPGWSGVRELLGEAVTALPPGYFALVMATGIVSISARLHGLVAVAGALFWINLAAYGTLVLFTAARLNCCLPRVARELTRHVSGPGFFTTVAGTAILGSQLVTLRGAMTAACGFWLVGLLLWLFLTYTFFCAVMVREPKPTLEEGLHGGWLVTVVSTQSIAVLGVLLAPSRSTGSAPWLFFAATMWLAGCALYLWIISLIFYRLLFFTLTPREFTPPYWVNTGAMAITTLAGALLILAAPRWQFLQEVLPFLKGFTLLFWATSTWWIPLLALLEIWRHVDRRYPIRYTPDYWDIVFPLGMYSTCTYQLAKALALPFLLSISRPFLYLALLLWIIVSVGLIRHLWRALTARLAQPEGDRPLPEASLDP